MDVLLLSRIQFALTAGFHFIFPPLSIGLGIFLIILEYKYIKTKEKMWENLVKFWIKIFALTFAVGVATGVVLEFEFGTNWERYSRFVGDVFGSPLAAEGVFAFFLESTFLGILVFGWNKVSSRTHFISTIMVAFGAHLSGLWILVANSWQQTPAGFHLVGQGLSMRAEIVDFWAMVFNPSTIQRFTHTIFASWTAAAFLFVSVNAYYLLKNRHKVMATKSIKIGAIVILITSLLMLMTGHFSSIEVAKYQPAKLAAFEGHWKTGPADMYLLGWVNDSTEQTYGIAIPGMLSYLVDFDPSTPVKGLKDFAPADRPPVNATFQTYHIMIALGMFFILYGIYAVLISYTKKDYNIPKWFLIISLWAFILPHIAIQLGWISAEVGRQPWIVYGLLRTKDAYSMVLTSGEIWASLFMFTSIYIILFILYIYILLKKIKQGPEEVILIEGESK
jgi:cytochrome d ubiquinol oxidase subunit I